MTFVPIYYPPTGGSSTAYADDVTIEGDGSQGLPFSLGSAAVGFITAKQYGVVGDGSTDDRVNLAAAIAAAAALGARLELGVGTFRLTQAGASPWCISLEQVQNLTIQGVKGKTIIKMATGMPASQVALLRLNGCKNVSIRDVVFDGSWGNAATTVTWISEGVILGSLPGGVLNVEDTTDFPSTGTLYLSVGASNTQTLTYTGKTATSFTGVVGGTGTVRAGMRLGKLDAATGINHSTQADPKSHLVMLRGTDGVTLEECIFRDSYGDQIWTGFRGDPIEDGAIPCRNTKLIRCKGRMSARNCVTVGQSTDGLLLDNCDFSWAFGQTFDVEAQGTAQYVRRIVIDGGYWGNWWNPQASTATRVGGAITIAITGAGVYGLLDADSARSVTIQNATIEGSCAIWASRFVTVFNNTFIYDFDTDATSGNIASVFVDHVSDGIDIINNKIYDRGKIVGAPTLQPLADTAFAAITVMNYPGLRPAGVRIAGNTIKVRNGRSGIKVSAAGAQMGGTENYTATAIAATTVTVAAAGWTIDEHVGKAIYRSGLVASVIANSATVLTHSGWFAPGGGGWIRATPTAGAFKLVSQSGVVRVEDNDIDCRDDGYGAGGNGIALFSGLSGGAIRVERNNIRSATGAGIAVDFAEQVVTFLSLVGNHVYDDAQTKTTTSAISFAGRSNLTTLVMHGNQITPGITHTTGLTSGSWQTSDSYPSSWAGYQDPNNLLYAPPASTYQRIDSKVIYVKQSSESSNTGWQSIMTSPRTVVRGVGTARSTTGTSINLSGYMPSSVDGDIEVLIAWNHDATTEPTLSTPAEFVKKVSGYGTVTYANRTAVFWRRFRTGLAAPVVSVPAGLAGAVVISLRDVVAYGDPFDTAVLQVDPDGNNAITFPTTTTTADNELVLNILTSYCGGGGATPGQFDTYVNASLTELEEVLDTRLQLASDIINVSVLSARKPTAGAISATTAQGYDSNQSATTLTLTFKSAVIASRATGTITCVAKASLVDTDYITIGDGINAAKLYEFDTANNGVTAGRVQVNVSTDTTAAQVAARLRTAILANHPTIAVVDNADGTLSLTHNWIGSGGNVAISENVANAGFLVTGMSGGAG